VDLFSQAGATNRDTRYKIHDTRYMIHDLRIWILEFGIPIEKSGVDLHDAGCRIHDIRSFILLLGRGACSFRLFPGLVSRIICFIREPKNVVCNWLKLLTQIGC